MAQKPPWGALGTKIWLFLEMGGSFLRVSLEQEPYYMGLDEGPTLRQGLLTFGLRSLTSSGTSGRPIHSFSPFPERTGPVSGQGNTMPKDRLLCSLSLSLSLSLYPTLSLSLSLCLYVCVSLTRSLCLSLSLTLSRSFPNSAPGRRLDDRALFYTSGLETGASAMEAGARVSERMLGSCQTA